MSQGAGWGQYESKGNKGEKGISKKESIYAVTEVEIRRNTNLTRLNLNF